MGYNIFEEMLAGLQTANPAWYTQLTGHLSEVQGKARAEVVTFADQRKAATESKKIELQGGYQFAQQTVPGGFNFGAPQTSPARNEDDSSEEGESDEEGID